jgi:hypothetical protein
VGGELAVRNAEALEHALRVSRHELLAIDCDDDRRRRSDALAHIEGYAALLRLPTGQEMDAQPVLYTFKLVFPDGRWSVGEKELADPPHEGDVLGFDDYGDWRVEGQQLVGVRPAGKPPRELFVCAPAA